MSLGTLPPPGTGYHDGFLNVFEGQSNSMIAGYCCSGDCFGMSLQVSAIISRNHFKGPKCHLVFSIKIPLQEQTLNTELIGR